VAPLIGPRTVEQLENLLPVLEMSISPEMLAACDAICPPGSAVANFHNSAPWMKMRIGP
jgi:aryl-alcohol dehydrogenase-like predicted oxidoreductase